MFKRLDRVGGSDGVLKGGFGEVGRGPQEVGHVCCVGVDTAEIGMLGIRCQIYAVGKFVGGGFVFLEGGFAKGGVWTNPPNPPLVTGLFKCYIMLSFMKFETSHPLIMIILL